MTPTAYRFAKIAAVVAAAFTIVAFAHGLVVRQDEEFSEEGGAVVIVEPRKHDRLGVTLELFLRRVPSSWKLYVFHGTDNGEYAADSAKSWYAEGRTVKLFDLGVSNLNASLYNRMFKTKQFWQIIEEENILVVQTDSVPCSASPLNLEYFAKKGFGYVGCAYGDRVGKNAYWSGHSFYGVGGLSLRRKSFALKVCDAFPPGTEPEAEDVAFSDGVDLFSSEYPKPSAGDLLDFCAQNASRTGRSWGAHQIGFQLPETEKSAFYDYCPESRGI